jgi:DNA-binding MarR family transcriptional regulator
VAVATERFEACVQVMRTNGALSRRFERALGGLHGLSLSDLVLLHELGKAPGGRLRRVELAERLSLSPSGVTRALIPLERIGLVTREREPRDARVGYAALTDTGRTRLEEALATADAVSRDVFIGAERMPELEALSRSLEQALARAPAPAERR